AAGQAAAVTHAVGTSAGTNAQSAFTQLMSAVAHALQRARATAGADPPSWITTIAGAAESIGGIITGPVQASVLVTIITGLGDYSSYLGGILDAAGPAGASSPGLGASAAGRAPLPFRQGWAARVWWGRCRRRRAGRRPPRWSDWPPPCCTAPIRLRP